jgi:CRP-like cAMP-binding protein
MENQFLMRLCSLIFIEAADLAALKRLIRDSINVQTRGIVCRAGEPVDYYPAVLAGWAARCQLLSNGERQITGLLLPGDLAYSSRHATPFANEEIIALSPCQIAYISRRALHGLMMERPGIADAMQVYAAVEYAISTAWLVSLGRRNALARIAHLLCELQHRMHQVETATPNSFSLPLTQCDLADALGLTPVHVNRKLQALRQDRLITLKSKNIEILDLPFLKASASFDPSYLDHAPVAAHQPALN